MRGGPGLLNQARNSYSPRFVPFPIKTHKLSWSKLKEMWSVWLALTSHQKVWATPNWKPDWQIFFCLFCFSELSSQSQDIPKATFKGLFYTLLVVLIWGVTNSTSTYSGNSLLWCWHFKRLWLVLSLTSQRRHKHSVLRRLWEHLLVLAAGLPAVTHDLPVGEGSKHSSHAMHHCGLHQSAVCQ